MLCMKTSLYIGQPAWYCQCMERGKQGSLNAARNCNQSLGNGQWAVPLCCAGPGPSRIHERPWLPGSCMAYKCHLLRARWSRKGGASSAVVHCSRMGSRVPPGPGPSRLLSLLSDCDSLRPHRRLGYPCAWGWRTPYYTGWNAAAVPVPEPGASHSHTPTPRDNKLGFV